MLLMGYPLEKKNCVGAVFFNGVLIRHPIFLYVQKHFASIHQRIN